MLILFLQANGFPLFWPVFEQTLLIYAKRDLRIEGQKWGFEQKKFGFLNFFRIFGPELKKRGGHKKAFF